MKNFILCQCVALLLSSFPLLAAPAAVEKVQFKSSKVLVWPDGKVLEAPTEITLPFSIIVRSNGTFTVKGGKTRTLQEGDTLGADGMLLKADGSISPVMDHVSANRGKVLVFKDGEAAELRETLTLGNGTTISPEGKITLSGGSERRLLDGELFQLDGGSLPVRDTITMKDGKVMVQKDGSMMTLEPARSVMMNDGTKVLGDGTVIKANGDQSTLSEGQVIILEGVVTRPR